MCVQKLEGRRQRGLSKGIWRTSERSRAGLAFQEDFRTRILPGYWDFYIA